MSIMRRRNDWTACRTAPMTRSMVGSRSGGRLARRLVRAYPTPARAWTGPSWTSAAIVRRSASEAVVVRCMSTGRPTRDPARPPADERNYLPAQQPGEPLDALEPVVDLHDGLIAADRGRHVYL